MTLPSTDGGDPYIIPLQLEGVTSYFPIRKPTQEEYEALDNPCYELTYETPDWDPHTKDFASREEAMTNATSMVVAPGDSHLPNHFILPVTCVDDSPVSDYFADQLCSNVNLASVASGRCRYGVDPVNLSCT